MVWDGVWNQKSMKALGLRDLKMKRNMKALGLRDNFRNMKALGLREVFENVNMKARGLEIRI